MTNLQAASSPPLLGRRALDLRSLRERYGVVIALIALCAALALANPHFMTWGNWADILRQTSINGILAIGMTCVVLTAGIDLSVGAILALAGMVGAWLAAPRASWPRSCSAARRSWCSPRSDSSSISRWPRWWHSRSS